MALSSMTSIQIGNVKIDETAELLKYLDIKSQEDCSSSTSATKDSIKRVNSITTVDESPRIFALIIGVDKYKDPEVHDLRGAVSDAKAIRNLLRDKLGVEKHRIRMLRNYEATRQGIINAFVSFQKNDEIQKGDAILIYYAGHGQEVEVEDQWETHTKIQSIVPHDFTSNGGIHVIPDRTIGRLIHNIMLEKGDNITVILDCCNSGSGTRNVESNSMVRSAMLKNCVIPPGLDDDITLLHNERSAIPPSEETIGALETHILISACSAYEQALERDGRGQFTQALVKVLQSVPPSEISYVELMDRLEHIAFQNPQLEGVNRHRMVFNAKAIRRTRNLYKVFFTPNSDHVLQAGGADGVSAGAQFTLYTDNEALCNKNPIGIYMAQDIRAFESTLCLISQPESTPMFGTSGIALQTRVGVQEELKVYVPLDKGLIPVFEALLLEMNQPATSSRKFALVNASAADLEIKREKDEIIFCILDKRVTSHGLTQCIFKAKPDPIYLRPILQGAAHYYYHLNRSYLSSENLGASVTIEFMKLQKTGNYDECGRAEWAPLGQNLIKNGIITLDINDSSDNIYGIRITNHGVLDLYPNIFYFDNSDLSIESYYSSGKKMQFKTDSPLQMQGGHLNLGFGNGGVRPFEYYIPDGQDVDVGFLKCFFSTSPIDLSSISQLSPFHTARSPEIVQHAPTYSPEAWCCVLIPIIQRRSSPTRAPYDEFDPNSNV